MGPFMSTRDIPISGMITKAQEDLLSNEITPIMSHGLIMNSDALRKD